MGMYQGIDVSHYQGTIDWQQVKRAGYEFAVLKATEGSSVVDPRYTANRAGARAAGFRVGAYHFGRISGDSPEKQAERFYGVAGAVDFYVLDIEDARASGQVGWWVLRFLQRLETLSGKVPYLYTYGYWWREHGSTAGSFARYPLWLASYTKSATAPSPWAQWTMWQYTSNGSVPGIAGRVDLNYAKSLPGAFAPAQPEKESDLVRDKRLVTIPPPSDTGLQMVSFPDIKEASVSSVNLQSNSDGRPNRCDVEWFEYLTALVVTFYREDGQPVEEGNVYLVIERR